MNRKQLEESSKQYGLVNFKPDDAEAAKRGFMAGALWRINSMWHDKNEEPKAIGMYAEQHYPQIPCLVYGISEGCGYGIRFWNVTEKCWDDEECDDYYCDKEEIEKWAYLDDLLPEGKEETK